MPPIEFGVHWTWVAAGLLGLALVVIAVSQLFRRWMRRHSEAVLPPIFARNWQVVLRHFEGPSSATEAEALLALRRIRLDGLAFSGGCTVTFRGNSVTLLPTTMKLIYGISLGYSTVDLAQIMALSTSHLYKLRKELRSQLALATDEGLDDAANQLIDQIRNG